jgi:enterochelin esterase-like enzyme
MVIVMPDASGEGKDHNGLNFGYFDQTNWPYERFFIEEFIPYIERTYRIKADQRTRAIAGLSMGGYGTMFYTMRHPELFSSACPISARMSGTPYNKNRSYTDEYITTLDSLAGVKIAQSLSDEQVAALRKVRLRVDCGDDDYLFDGNIDFVRALRSHKIPVELRVRDGGHSWIYWQTALPDILTYVSIGFME